MENFHLYSLPHHFPGLPWVRPVEIHQARRGATLSWLKSPLPSKLGTWLLCSLGLRYRAQDPTEATSREAVGRPPSFCEPQFPHVCSTVSLQSSKDRALFSMSCCCSFAKLCLILYDPMDPKQHARLPCPYLSPRIWACLYPLSQGCHPTISSSLSPFSSCPQSFPASGSFQICLSCFIKIELLTNTLSLVLQ